VGVLVIGGSDAGIEAGPQAAARGAQVDLVVADAYPNFSVRGIPYYLSGEVGDWRNLAHRDRAAPEAAGLTLHLDTRATGIDTATRRVRAEGRRGQTVEFTTGWSSPPAHSHNGHPSPDWTPSDQTPAYMCCTHHRRCPRRRP
jgi:NADPH-dependent 2,4-dienoyl-CoA reductase/sulfur reductase-like enzyme